MGNDKLLKVGDWVVVTSSTIDNLIAGKILQIVKVDANPNTAYTYLLKVENRTQWGNGIAPSELIKALL